MHNNPGRFTSGAISIVRRHSFQLSTGFQRLPQEISALGLFSYIIDQTVSDENKLMRHFCQSLLYLFLVQFV